MSNYYPTLVRNRAPASYRGGALAPLAAPRTREPGAPRSGELFPGIPYGYPDRFRGPSLPRTPFGRKASPVLRKAARIEGLWRTLYPSMGERLREQLTDTSIKRMEADGVSPVANPGAGFSIAAQCATGGALGRLYNTSVLYPWPNPGPINACLVSTAYFPGAEVDASTRSFAWVEPRPRPGLPYNAKGVIAWHRPIAGPVNAPFSIKLHPVWQNWQLHVQPSPAVLPYAFPLTAPLEVPVGQELSAPLSPGVGLAISRYAGVNPWVQRETSLQLGRAVPAAQARRHKEMPAALPQNWGASGNGRIYDAPGHVSAPPPPGAKERKLKTNWAKLGQKLLVNAATEFGDFVGAIHDALPAKWRRARTWKDKDGKWHRKRIDSMLRDLWQHWDELDLGIALNNLVANEIEDLVIGKTQQTLNKASRGSGFGLGTNLTKYSEQAGLASPAQQLAKWVGDATFSNRKNGTGPSAYAKQRLAEARAHARGQASYRRNVQ